ncbi:adaptor protein MecA [Lachnoclostridium sp. Marseille-P6806]|uniref:adaptor protein MecA n=1 Tax=Lachnoclostridium sp. Marseille-P6806 TaxID=2364793 RepID=UPI0010314A55|nr:adaptor protein MecA [Lachnoclostridium sp. Marseille-P6806]
MKIERLNDNQIRCTLTGEDLAKRNIRLSELAYGSDKARRLFSDMMQQAAVQFGFSADNIPLMIEAIPLNSESIVLVVTKVEDPEELDTRFSNFAPSVEKEAGGDDAGSPSTFERLMDAIRQGPAEAEPEARGGAGGNDEAAGKGLADLRRYIFTHRLFSFENMNDVIAAARLASPDLGPDTHCALYFSETAGRYHLVLAFPDPDAVKKHQNVLACLSEYGAPEVMSFARELHLQEHERAVCPENALATLAAL